MTDWLARHLICRWRGHNYYARDVYYAPGGAYPVSFEVDCCTRCRQPRARSGSLAP